LRIFHFDSWNWQGKVLQAMLSLSALLLFSKASLGLGLSVTNFLDLKVWLVFIAVVSFGYGLSRAFPTEGGKAHQLIYQLTMPGLAEELFYRSALLAIFFSLFKSSGCATWEVNAYASTLVIFCFDHVFSVTPDGKLSIQLVEAIIPAIVGTALTWLRFRTGSIYVGILAHNIFNSM